MIRLKSYKQDQSSGITIVVYEVVHNTQDFDTTLTLDVVLKRQYIGPWEAKVVFEKCDAATVPEVLKRLGSWCSRLSEALDTEMDVKDVIPMKEVD